MQMSRQEARSSAGPDHVTLQALITWLIKSRSRDCACTDDVADRAAATAAAASSSSGPPDIPSTPHACASHNTPRWTVPFPLAVEAGEKTTGEAGKACR